MGKLLDPPKCPHCGEDAHPVTYLPVHELARPTTIIYCHKCDRYIIEDDFKGLA